MKRWVRVGDGFVVASTATPPVQILAPWALPVRRLQHDVRPIPDGAAPTAALPSAVSPTTLMPK